MSPGVSLPHFNATDVWAAPGVAINSTEAFDHATKLERTAYIANRYLFIAIMVVLAGFVLLSMPGTLARMRYSPRWWWGAYLKRTRASSKSNDTRTTQIPPRPYNVWNPIPARTVPILGLTWFEAALVAVLWIVVLGLAAWCQSAFLTHASRATLIIMGLVVLSAALGVKSGGIGSWTSCGYTAINYLHRWTGRLVLLLTTLHVIAYLVVFYKAGIATVEMRKPENYLAAIAYGGLCLAGLGSVRPIRQSSWLVFKYAHHIGILLLMAGLNYHAPDIVPYLLAAWILLALNTIFRSLSTRIVQLQCTALPSGSGTLVETDIPYEGFVCGQHIRLRCVTGLGAPWTALESHPFTIASANGQNLQLVVRNAGDWTERLHRAAENGGRLRCTLEGPYGGPSNFMFSAFESVCLVVGGSGISFGLGVANGVIHDVLRGRSRCKRLTLLWSARHIGHLTDVAGLLAQLPQANEMTIAIKLFHTSPIAPTVDSPMDPHGAKVLDIDPPALSSAEKAKAAPVSLDSLANACTSLQQGRPDTLALLTEVVSATENGGVGIGVCGPIEMVQRVEQLCRGFDKQEQRRVGAIQVHAERFSL